MPPPSSPLSFQRPAGGWGGRPSSASRAPPAMPNVWSRPSSSPSRIADEAPVSPAHHKSVRTFADVLSNGACTRDKQRSFNAFKHPLPSSFDNIHNGIFHPSDSVGIKKISTHEGKPSIYLSNEELKKLAEPLDLTLVGKFPAGRPKWTALLHYFKDLNLVGSYRLSHLDSKHVVIHFTSSDDYIRVFTRTVTTIGRFTVKFFKWSMDFDVHQEPSVTPVWINMPMLKMSLFTQNMIYSIAKAFGRPLLIDPPTAAGLKPGIARALVEMNLLAIHPSEVWMGNEDYGYWQEVKIERKPKYCAHCRKYGHLIHECYVKDPELQKNQKNGKQSNDNSKELSNDKETEIPIADGDNQNSHVMENEPPIAADISQKPNDWVMELSTSEMNITEKLNQIGGIFNGNTAQMLPNSKSSEKSNLGPGAVRTGDAVSNETLKKYWRDVDQMQMRFWNDYRNQMLDDSENLNQPNAQIEKEQSAGSLRQNEATCTKSQEQNKTDIAAQIREHAKGTIDESAVKLIENTILESIQRLIVECYEKSFQDEQLQPIDQQTPEKSAVMSDQEDLIENFSSEAVPEDQVTQKDQNEEDHSISIPTILTANLTKQNTMDILCMGFNIQHSINDEDINSVENISTPHSGNEKLWKYERNSSSGVHKNLKKGKKKKKASTKASSGGPRRTRGRPKGSSDYM